MKINSFIFLYVFSIIGIAAQNEISIRGKVNEINTSKLISYVNIMCVNHSNGTTSNKNGCFELIITKENKNDSIIFSHIGYKSIKKSVKDIISDSIVFLTPKTIILDEVNITNRNDSKKVRLNKFKKNKTATPYSIQPFTNNGGTWVPFRENEPSIETVFFSYDSLYGDFPEIKEVEICLKSFKDGAIFKLRIYKPNASQIPDEDILLSNPIIETKRGDNVVTIDLSNDKVYMSENGIFVGIEYLLIPDNAKSIKNEIGNETTLYSPFLMYTSEKEFYEYYIYSKGEWIKQNKKVPEIYPKRPKNKYYKPAISILLSTN